jgi:hypothetical protein
LEGVIPEMYLSAQPIHYLGDVNITGKEGDKVSSYKEMPFAGKHC